MGDALDTAPRGAEDQTVRLDVPARADYVLLARLALSAVSRLTELGDAEVADLKLALTEAAGTFVGDADPDAEGVHLRAVGDLDDATLRFSFVVGGDGLAVQVECEGGEDIRQQDRELSLAIIDATVDEFSSRPGSIRLVKRPGEPEG